MHKTTVQLLAILAITTITNIAYANVDPFANSTYYLGTRYTLKIYNHAPDARNYTHSIWANFPDGEELTTNTCNLSSQNILKCEYTIGDEHLVYNAGKHSITISGPMAQTTIYYEKGHQPQGSALSGTWKAQQPICSTISMNVPYAAKSATTFHEVHTDNHDGYTNLTYYLVKNQLDSSLHFRNAPPHARFVTDNYLLYNAQNELITNIQQLDTVVTLRDKNDPRCSLIKSDSAQN